MRTALSNGTSGNGDQRLARCLRSEEGMQVPNTRGGSQARESTVSGEADETAGHRGACVYLKKIKQSGDDGRAGASCLRTERLPQERGDRVSPFHH